MCLKAHPNHLGMSPYKTNEYNNYFELKRPVELELLGGVTSSVGVPDFLNSVPLTVIHY